MAFALVHFAVGFVTVLAVLSALGVARHRLTWAYAGGVWALLPDAHHLLDGPVGASLGAMHGTPQADLFFLHATLDGAWFRAHNVELTALSLAVLGVAFAWHDRRHRVRRLAAEGSRPAAEGSDRAR